MKAKVWELNFSRTYVGEYTFLLGPLVIMLTFSYLSPLKIDYGILFWVVDILVFWVIPISSLYIVHKRYGVSPWQYGLFKKLDKYLYSGKDFFADILVASLGFFLMGSASYWIICAFFPSGCSESGYFSDLEKYGFLSYWLIKIYLSANAAIFEEIYYRGILYKIFSGFVANEKIMGVLYVGVSSLLFTLLHFSYPIAGCIAIFFVGVFACSFYLHSKRLEPLVLGHFIFDITV